MTRMSQLLSVLDDFKQRISPAQALVVSRGKKRSMMTTRKIGGRDPATCPAAKDDVLCLWGSWEPAEEAIREVVKEAVAEDAEERDTQVVGVEVATLPLLGKNELSK